MKNYKRYTSKDGATLTMSQWGGSPAELELYRKLAELEDKIDKGSLIEMPRIVRRGDMSCGYEEYLVQWEKDNGKIKSRIYHNERSAKAKLRELKE